MNDWPAYITLQIKHLQKNLTVIQPLVERLLSIRLTVIQPLGYRGKMREEKPLGDFQQNVITIELLWHSVLPHIPAPHQKFIKTWARHYTFEQISMTLEEVVRLCDKRGITDTALAGRIASTKLRTKYGNDESVRALHIPA